MGTAGNRSGYKVFCFNTTIRNPKRNREFLQVFEPFNGMVFNEYTKLKYYYELVRNGTYHLSNVPDSIRLKWENGEELTKEEIKSAIRNNPQACGDAGRVMTQLRALKDQGFLMFENSKTKPTISLTSLGKDLIDNIKDPTIVYTKAMLGTHAKSIIRSSIFNESRPFLNTLFVIDEVNRRWEKMNSRNIGKGLLFHEFGAFVLTMKDCDYLSCADKIIEYRKQFRFEANKHYLESYLENEDILPMDFKHVINDYPDEVLRKFEMTGLVVRRGSFSYRYIDFSNYNRAKVETILAAYRDYKFEDFCSTKDYYDFLNNQIIPWENNLTLREKIVNEKTKILGITLNESYSLEEKEEFLDRQFYSKSLQKAVDKYDFSFISRELLILANHLDKKSELDSISEPLRLEYLLALYFGKKYGLKGLISNIIYDEDGIPLHCAPGGKGDIIFHNSNASYILEPTMITSKSQQLNSETANIVRHMKSEEQKYEVPYRVMMIAPVVHSDVIEFFRFKAITDNANIASITIDKTIGLFDESDTIKDLGLNFDEIVSLLKRLSPDDFSEKINTYRYKPLA